MNSSCEESMVAQDNDEYADVNSRQVAYQEDDNLKLQNENTQENKELHEQNQAFFSSTLEILDQKFKQELDRVAKDAYKKTPRYIANLQPVFGFLEEKLQISQDHDMLDGSDWEYRTANTLHITYEQFERFHAKVTQKLDLHLNEYAGKFTVETYSVSSQHEQHPEENQRKKMKSNEKPIELLQTETTHIMKTKEQLQMQAKPILKTSSRRGDPVDD